MVVGFLCLLSSLKKSLKPLRSRLSLVCEPLPPNLYLFANDFSVIFLYQNEFLFQRLLFSNATKLLFKAFHIVVRDSSGAEAARQSVPWLGGGFWRERKAFSLFLSSFPFSAIAPRIPFGSGSQHGPRSWRETLGRGRSYAASLCNQVDCWRASNFPPSTFQAFFAVSFLLMWDNLCTILVEFVASDFC
jgi:hypothetical protein